MRLFSRSVRLLLFLLLCFYFCCSCSFFAVACDRKLCSVLRSNALTLSVRRSVRPCCSSVGETMTQWDQATFPFTCSSDFSALFHPNRTIEILLVLCAVLSAMLARSLARQRPDKIKKKKKTKYTQYMYI